MKVTALIPDDLLAEVRKLAPGKTLTESLTSALRERTALQKLRKAQQKIKRNPLTRSEGFSADQAKAVNRRFRY